MFCRKSHEFSTVVSDGGDDGGDDDGDGGSTSKEAAGNLVVTRMTGIKDQLESRLCSMLLSVWPNLIISAILILVQRLNHCRIPSTRPRPPT